MLPSFQKMAAGGSTINICDHGMALNKKKSRVQCNYCGKIVSGFFHLNCHLGGVRGDVTPCEKVPENTKELLRNILLETNRDSFGKEQRELYHPNPSRKRNWCSNSNFEKHGKFKITQTVGCQNEGPEEIETISDDCLTESVSIPNGSVGSHTAVNGETKQFSRQLEKCIGRFFYEMGLDFSAIKSSSFNRMINTSLHHGHSECRIPSCQELKGWILQDEVKEMHEYVEKIRHSWAVTGCSILLDGWNDGKGRSVVNFLVDCPEGLVYLRSYDVSPFLDDADALQLMLSEVIEEVGIENVVQIVACSSMGWEGTVGKQFMERCRSVFWTVSVSHCIELMLEKIEMMESVKGVLDKAKTITKFIHGHAVVLQILEKYTCGESLIKPSKMKTIMSFLTLENIVLKKQKLLDMFASLEWTMSFWASEVEGKRVADLVGDHSLWTGAEMVLKATIPLLRAVSLISGSRKPTVGYIYETMDQIKETIKREFKSKKAHYMPFWQVIDEIWDTYLHSPLHAAGYYLNPSLFYSSDFFVDAEVAFGLLCCIVRMVKDQRSQDLITRQLDEYRHARGGFKEGSALNQRTTIPPVLWWSKYGQQYPDLQKFALRILSQHCEGASRFGLNRSLAERLLTKGRNHIEQQRLIDFTFVHYNMQLQQYRLGVKNDLVAEEIDAMSDWVLDETPQILSQNGSLTNGGRASAGLAENEF